MTFLLLDRQIGLLKIASSVVYSRSFSAIPAAQVGPAQALSSLQPETTGFHGLSGRFRILTKLVSTWVAVRRESPSSSYPPNPAQSTPNSSA